MIEATPLSEVIEKHIDRIGLPQMIELIAIICDEKADHIRINWQDHSGSTLIASAYSAAVIAGMWERTAKELDAIAAKAKARGIK